METEIIAYSGKELGEFCGNMGYSRIAGESDWSLRKRFFVEVYGLSPDLAMEILFGRKLENFTDADKMMCSCLFVGQETGSEGFTKEQLQKYVNGFNIDPLTLREGSPMSVEGTTESVDYTTLSREEYKKRLIAIVNSSRSKRDIKDRIRGELQYPKHYGITLYYGTMNSPTAVLSASGVKVVICALHHPEGLLGIGWN